MADGELMHVAIRVTSMKTSNHVVRQSQVHVVSSSAPIISTPFSEKYRRTQRASAPAMVTARMTKKRTPGFWEP